VLIAGQAVFYLRISAHRFLRLAGKGFSHFIPVFVPNHLAQAQGRIPLLMVVAARLMLGNRLVLNLRESFYGSSEVTTEWGMTQSIRVPVTEFREERVESAS
jgi:hypothetical protein